MAETQAYKAAQLIEARRIGYHATGIPTIADQATADEIDRMYEEEFARRLTVARGEALESAEKAFNRESLGFQKGWSSSPEDVMKLDMIQKSLDWIKARAAKYSDQLPRTINLKDTYKSLSDGAQIEYRGTIFTHMIGYGEFRSDFGDTITARLHDEDVKLVSHNL
jgi:hypothetical protein